jgi:hypothetical protein
MKNSCTHAVVAGAVLLIGTGTAALQAQAQPATITVTSAGFKDNETMPNLYAVDGKDVSPPITWTGLPASAKQITLICDDPDARGGMPVTHWLIYKIPPTAKGLPEALPFGEKVTTPPELAGAIQSKSGQITGYWGPAPGPGKAHHYHFRVYALDAALDLQPGLDKNALLDAMKGHVIGEGDLVGVWEKLDPATPPAAAK